MRLRAGDAEDMIPFFVRPPRNAATSKVCVLIPTFTYVIYGNNARGTTPPTSTCKRVAESGARPWTPDEHGEYGLSTYNFHTDGSGIRHASALRPMINLKVGLPVDSGSSPALGCGTSRPTLTCSTGSRRAATTSTS